MDFVVGLPHKEKGYDSIWVIVDHLTKSIHFLLVDTRYSAKKYAKLYFERIVTLHGVFIICDERSTYFNITFLLCFWCLNFEMISDNLLYHQLV